MVASFGGLFVLWECSHYYLEAQAAPDSLEAQSQVLLFLLSVLGSLSKGHTQRETQKVRVFDGNTARSRTLCLL